jgi:hypothetical protein
MSQLSRISPISDTDAARTVRAATLTDLAAQITATAVPAASPRTIKSSRRRVTLIAVATSSVAGVAAAAIIAATAGQPAPVPVKADRSGRPASTGTTQLTAALSFTTSAGYITVRVINPLADPSRYRAEFAAHHLNISLSLVPVSPSLVGTLVYFSEPAGGGITAITAKGQCFTGGGGSACPVAVRIPASFRSQAQITFGRAARPGERYESTAPATAPGEVLHGLTIAGKTVAQVLAMLRQRNVTVSVYNYNDHGYGRLLHAVPGDWYVYDADPWALNQVMLFVGPVWPQPMLTTPAPGAPVPSPTHS